ncbi:MAG: hypothetical protein HYY85_07315 [Deltaproteobacteria bacterium]|nr:hypothetical protein [Deltaproteobacteria bacterium]
MSAKQKALAWGMGILAWINLLSVLVSTWQFGYVDWTTVRHMGMIALPPLAVGGLLLYLFRPVAERDRRVEKPSTARVAGARAPLGAER